MGKLRLPLLVLIVLIYGLESAAVAPPAPTTGPGPAESTELLRAGFTAPPDSAKPQTWWHWMNGNVTHAGITADLEAMKRIGLGGATIVNADCGIPRGSVDFMSPQWRDDVKFAVTEADRLGLKLCVENCAGWSSSGGPWNTPANAMQRLTSSELQITGPAKFDAVLVKPPIALETYHDIAVLAFQAPAVVAQPPTTVPAGHVEKLEIEQAVYEPAGGGGGSADVKGKLMDLIKAGRQSVTVTNTEMGGDPASGQVKHLRLVFTLDGKPDTLTVDENDLLIFPVNGGQFAKARGAAKTSVDRTYVQPPDSASAAGQLISSSGVIDLTDRMSPDGRLQWAVPDGKWIVLRLGYTPIGVENHPAPDQGRGLECDKLSKSALDAHWAGCMQKVVDDAGPLAGRSLGASLIDSYEVGNQDWTPKFRQEFIARRGYDPLKFLPTYTRRVVDSPEMTDRFLWDMRRTVADLFAENYYGHFTELCHQNHLISMIEPYTGPFEPMQCGAANDVVMGEFWTGSQGQPSVKMAASIAHVYGRQIVGAEAFTAGGTESRWQNDPYSLKQLGDLMFCQGINRYVFHRYAMQPWMDHRPGMTMGEYGLNFERTQTWWEQGKPWIDYISRCQFMLQQGRSVSDVAYFTGETAPAEMREGDPAMPAGYDWDAVNADVLMHGAAVENGRVKLARGASYGVLVLPPGDSNMTPGILECIARLVHDGATVTGPRPMRSPSLNGYPDCDLQVKKLADDLWGRCDGKSVTENPAGKGRIVWGKPLAEVLTAESLKPDFQYTGETAGAKLQSIHRSTGKQEIYFVANQQPIFQTVECTFRVTGRTPQIWHPDTGAIEPAPVWVEENGRTSVRIDFDPTGSVFVVFGDGQTADHIVAAAGAVDSFRPVEQAIEIRHAVYTATDAATAKDVTAKLVALVVDGRISLNVTNDTLGGDPATLHPKELRVDYAIGGKLVHAVVPEHQTFAVPSTPQTGTPPAWAIIADRKWPPSVRMWGNGLVTLHAGGEADFTANAAGLPAPREIDGPWKINFPSNLGAPPSVDFDHLMSWTESTDRGVKYFSGTATYEKDFTVAADQLTAGTETWLDLGTVKNFADVTVNGQPLGLIWKPPFSIDITPALKTGVNHLTVKVTNLWPNRLIGDEQLPPDCQWNGGQLKQWPQWLLDGKPSPTGRIAFASWHHWNKDDALLESGMIGPAVLRTAKIVRAK